MERSSAARDRPPRGIYIMDDRDRTIVVFGGNDNEPSYDPQDVQTVRDDAGISVDTELAQDVASEAEAYSGAESYSGTYAYDSGSDTSDTYESYADMDEPERDYTPVRNPIEPYSRPAKEPKYVTRGFLVLCMVLTMIVSSVLGAFLGGAFGGSGNSSRSSSGSSASSDDGGSSLSLSDATGSDLTISEIVDRNADAVVEILVSGTSRDYFGQMQITEGAGSGVIVTDDGYIVTNYHVIQGANKVQVTLHNGETYPASIVGGDNDNDIAVVKINATDLTTAEIGDSSTVAVGDTAVAIGNPLGQLGGTATTGIISALDRNLTIDGRTLTLMQTDAAINGGNSGGGLFNSKGQLIGIVDAKSSGVGIEGLAFAIPINSVIDTINDLISNGTVSARPVVGITIQDVSEENAQYYQLESAGVYIAQVTGENAQKAGFEQGDRIISLDGEEINDSQTFISKIRSHKVGDTVAIVVSRDGQEIEIRTELEEYTSID